MALDKNKLKQALVDNFTTIRESNLSTGDSADGLAQAIVDYAKDAEIQIPAPVSGFIMATGGAPDPTVAGKKLKVNSGAVSGGKSALVSAIIASYNSGDSTMNLISVGIVAFAALMLNFSNSINTITAVGATLMSAPPIFISSTQKGMDGGTIADVSDEMANAIDTSFKASIFTGAGANIGPPPSATVVLTGALI